MAKRQTYGFVVGLLSWLGALGILASFVLVFMSVGLGGLAFAAAGSLFISSLLLVAAGAGLDLLRNTRDDTANIHDAVINWVAVNMPTVAPEEEGRPDSARPAFDAAFVTKIGAETT